MDGLYLRSENSEKCFQLSEPKKTLLYLLIAEMWTTSFLGKLFQLDSQYTPLSALCRCCGGNRCMLISITCSSKFIWVHCFTPCATCFIFFFILSKLIWDFIYWYISLVFKNYENELWWISDTTILLSVFSFLTSLSVRVSSYSSPGS